MRGFSKTVVGPALLVACTLGAGQAQAQSANAWLHVRVEEPRNESKVSVNVPLSLVAVALAAAPENIASKGHLHIGSRPHDLSVSDLRKMWKELKAVGDNEFVSIEDDHETVKVARVGDKVKVVCTRSDRDDSVNVEVPVAIVDALLSGSGDEINTRDAIAQLQALRGEIVRVKDKDSTVHIWIDERS